MFDSLRIRSIRARLQLWYAVVLLGVIASFGGVLYARARTASFQQVDAQLAGAAHYLDATLRTFPPHEMNGDGDGGSPRPLPPPPPRRFRPDLDDFEDGPEDRRGGRPPRQERPEDHPDDQGERPRHDFGLRGPGRDDAGPPGDRPFRSRPPEEDPRGEGPGGFGPRGSHPRQRTREDLFNELDPRSRMADPTQNAEENAIDFVVWREDRTILKSTLPDMKEPPAAVAETSAPGELRYAQTEDARQAFLTGPRQSFVLVQKSITRELAALRSFAFQLLGGGALAVTIGLAGGWVLANRILRPIAAISATAATMSATNLSGRIEPGEIDSELVELAEVLNATFARLEDAFERQARFTADASHELRTPLAVLHSNLQLALSRPRSAAEYQQTLQSCLGASSRMRALVDGLLVLARADARRLDLDLKPIDLRLVAEEAIEQVRPSAEAAGVLLSMQTAKTPITMPADAMLLNRVLANLLSNAIRCTPAGGAVRLAVSTDGKSAVLSVADTGCGISLADQVRVFERFFRTDQARSRASGGNGLGLAITKSLVEAHGGTIRFVSSPDHGTTFTISLPLAGNPNAATVAAPALPVSMPAQPLASRTPAKLIAPPVIGPPIVPSSVTTPPIIDAARHAKR